MLPNEEEKKDPRVKRTRQSIEQAFLNLMTEKGFQALSVQDITEHAGINRATFYAHFPDKYDLLDHFIRKEFHQLVENRMLNACQFSLVNLRSLIIAVCEFVDNAQGRCSMTEKQFRLLVASQVRTQVNTLILHWLGNTGPEDEQTVMHERAATASSWAIYGLATKWSQSKRVPPVEQYADEVLPLIAANLSFNTEPDRVLQISA
ncbi:MAG TPA: TetR family transcriptional regulator [Prolixibacteraceae bacterium]